MEGEVVTAMEGAITTITSLVNGVMTIVEGNTTLMAMFVVPLFGAGIGLLSRLRRY